MQAMYSSNVEVPSTLQPVRSSTTSKGAIAVYIVLRMTSKWVPLPSDQSGSTKTGE